MSIHQQSSLFEDWARVMVILCGICLLLVFYNRQFLLLRKMVQSNNKLINAPIAKSHSNRNMYTASVSSKRASSLKPSISKAPTLPVDFLPPIKTTLPVKKVHHQSLRQKPKASRNGFDDRIINSKCGQGNRNEKVRGMKMQGLSKDELFQRKQSNLNTYFNTRKNRLKQITNENKKIYVRINSQKSLYSSRELNKSYESNSSLSRRLSNSKLSKCSSRHSAGDSSSRKGQINKQRFESKKKEIKIESHNINKVQINHIHRYLNIFCNNVNIKPKSVEKGQGEGGADRKRSDKENQPLGRLQKIIEEFSRGPVRKTNVLLARLL